MRLSSMHGIHGSLCLDLEHTVHVTVILLHNEQISGLAQIVGDNPSLFPVEPV